MIKFASLTPAEQLAVDAIVDRAGVPKKDRPSEMHLRMDLQATHATTPLRLEELAEADDFNLVHDVAGIWRHLDRDGDSPTGGQLTGFFVPRFARRSA